MLLLTLLSGTTISSQKTTTPSLASTSCEPAVCGGLRIAYPFWLGGTHPPECAYQAFRVTCDTTGKAFYEERSFRVTNDVELSNGTCDIELRMNASSDLGLVPFNISPTNQEPFFLQDCTNL